MTAPHPEVHPCPHCGTPVEGPRGTYCCHGCEMAAAIIAGAGLQSYYDDREQAAPRVGTDAQRVAWDAVPVLSHDDGTCSVRLDVDGFRCASCVWVTEKVLEQSEGVSEAGVSYANGRATLRFDPARTSLDDLAGTIQALGYRPRPAGSTSTVDRDLLTRLGVAAFGAANVMGVSVALYTGWLDGMDERFAQLFRWVALLMATPVVTWSAAPFFVGAWRGLRAGVLHMDLPIALAVGVLYLHGLVATPLHVDTYLDSLTMLVALLLVGRVLEARGRKRTAEAASSLAALVPTRARRVVKTPQGESIEEVPTDDLALGDLIELSSGEEVGADGVVVSGQGEVEMALLTGESEPTRVVPGDRLVAGATVLTGALRLGVTHTGEHTLLQTMAEGLVTASDAPRTPTAADRLAPVFTGATLAVALTTGGLLAWLGLPDAALPRMVAVLVVACPCALALAGPLVGAAGLGAVARRGGLLGGPDVLARLADVDVVVLDKTGTVTTGHPRVVAAQDEALRLAAGLERYSRHPIASAILDEAVARGIPIPPSTDVQETAGQGVSGEVDGHRWTLRSGGPGRVRLSSDDGRAFLIRLEDRPRAQAAADLHRLTRLGLSVQLLSGDHDAVTRRIGEAVGLREVRGGATPQAKVERIEALKAAGHTVLFVGDGLNDGPALSAADVGLAMGTGAASSVLAADGVIAGDSLRPLAAALAAGRDNARRVQANLWRSALYNVAAVGGAVVGLVNPLVAAILMPLSSGLVIASAAGTERAVSRRLDALDASEEAPR